jgi:YesN/AraC family two-component response regulator
MGNIAPLLDTGLSTPPPTETTDYQKDNRNIWAFSVRLFIKYITYKLILFIIIFPLFGLATEENSVKINLYPEDVQIKEENLKTIEQTLLDEQKQLDKQDACAFQNDYHKMLVQFYVKKGNTENLNVLPGKFFHPPRSLSLKEKQQALAELSFINKLKEKETIIGNQQLQIERQKSRLLIAVLLFLITYLALIFSIVFSRYRYRKLLTYYKENFELSVSRNPFYNHNRNDRQVEGVGGITSGESEKFRRIYNGVLRLFEKENIYLNSNLSIRDISKQLYTNEKYVSKAIKLGSKMNFPNFLNKYRVNEAIKYMNTPLHDPLTLEQIMEKTGFYSRSTFNSAFKNITGISPGQYRNKPANTKIIELSKSAG